jgi:hypothetical protein
LVEGRRRLPGGLGQGNAKLLGHCTGDVHHLITRLIVVEQNIAAEDSLKLLLRRNLVDGPLQPLQERLHQFLTLLLHLALALLRGLLQLTLTLLQLALALYARRVVQQGLLLLKLLNALLKLLSLLLNLALLLLHFLLHLLLHVLHARHAGQDGPLVDITDLLGLRRRHRQPGNKKEK